MQRVVTQDEFGGPNVLQVVAHPLPEPLRTEIRVRIEAAGVNPVDAKTRAGAGVAPILGDPPFVLGWDVVGTVDALGGGVTRFAVGDRVIGMPWFPREAGCYAEYVTAPSRHFVQCPEDLDGTQAAGLPLAGLTAWQALRDTAHVEAGQRVLVTGAAGGVGHLAVQIASAFGAHVTGVASEQKLELVAEMGANEVIDYQKVDLAGAVRDIDVALELVGGEATTATLRTLRPGGTLVVIAGPVSEDVAAVAEAAGVRLAKLVVEPDHLGLSGLCDLVAAGTLQVVVSEVFRLAEAPDAHRAIETGRTVGKIVVTP